MFTTSKTIKKNYRKCTKCLHFRALFNAFLSMGVTAALLSTLIRMA